MIVLLAAAVVLGFPACATWAVRTGGRWRLWLTTGLALVAIAALAGGSMLIFGRRPPDRSLAAAVLPVLLLAGWSLGLPVVIGALSIEVARLRLRAGWALHLVAAILAFVAFVVATMFAVYQVRPAAPSLAGRRHSDIFRSSPFWRARSTAARNAQCASTA
jgi:hypothetical protein